MTLASYPMMHPPAPCPVLSECGGCPEMSSPPDRRHAELARRLELALGRAPDALIASPRSLGYRARVAFNVDGAGRLGYHRPGTHELAEIPACAIARPELNLGLAALREGPVGPGLDRVELRTDGVKVVVNARAARRDARLARAAAQALALPDVALDGQRVKGDPSLRLEVAGVLHHVSPGSFTQVNLEVNALLVEALRRLVLALKPAAVLDLYAGIGNLSLPLAASGVPVTLVESSPSSVKDARATAARLGLPATVVQADAGRVQAGERFFDVAVLDPPRAGAPGLLPRLLLTRPRALVYVSCNPHTLARDLREAAPAGYRLTHLVALDMFPQTRHAEALALIERATG